MTKKKLVKMKESLLRKNKESVLCVGYSTCGIAAGAQEVWGALKEEVAKRGLDVELKKVGCAGMCYAEPLLEVRTAGMPDVVYGKVTARTVPLILDEHLGNGKLVEGHIVKINPV